MKKAVRRFLQGCSLTAAMFVFQACYGVPEYVDMLPFCVVDEDGDPIPNIRLESRRNFTYGPTDWEFMGLTDSNGLVYGCYDKGYLHITTYHFTDSDSVYSVKDTVMTRVPDMDEPPIRIVLKKNVARIGG